MFDDAKSELQMVHHVCIIVNQDIERINSLMATQFPDKYSSKNHTEFVNLEEVQRTLGLHTAHIEFGAEFGGQYFNAQNCNNEVRENLASIEQCLKNTIEQLSQKQYFYKMSAEELVKGPMSRDPRYIELAKKIGVGKDLPPAPDFYSPPLAVTFSYQGAQQADDSQSEIESESESEVDDDTLTESLPEQPTVKKQRNS